LEGAQNPKFMVFHPAWGYFARDFGLEQIAVEVGGQEPSAQELAHLITEAKEEGIQVIFAQPEFSARSAETIASEIGGKVLLISPLAPDWLDNMRRVARTFSEVMGRR
jgi:zinc transport system substrate-binding protein